jgi:pimeloyl-ACP methyl ester carboxylesterase
MATYVLVHGAWHGGWCWRKVAPLLRAAGHDVHTPTLSGLGDRVHLASPDIDLDTHVRDIVNVLEYEDLRSVVLVGHSYGGMVITGVAGQAADRLGQLVYLDAFVPGDGETLLDFVPAERRDGFLRDAQTSGEGWRIPAPPLGRFGVTDEADLAWANPRITDQPLRTFAEPIKLTGEPPELPRTYIWCLGYATAGSFGPFAARARTEPGWRYHELDTGHDAMITTPQDVARILLDLA